MTVKNQIIALNNLLSDLFEQEGMRISRFLSKIGLAKNDIETIGNNRMKELADGLTMIFKHRMFDTDARLFDIIERRYGLNGQTPLTLRQIGDDFNLSRERVRQLQKMALNHCKNINRLELLGKYAKSIALGILAECKNETEPGGTEFLPLNGQNSLDNIPKKIDRNYHVPQIRYLPEDGNVIRIADEKTGHAVFLREDAIGTFLVHLKEAISAAGWNKKPQDKRKAEIKQKYPRAYESWTENEEKTLKEGFKRGMGPAELSAILKRQPSAVESRLAKLGLKTGCKNGVKRSGM